MHERIWDRIQKNYNSNMPIWVDIFYGLNSSSDVLEVLIKRRITNDFHHVIFGKNKKTEKEKIFDLYIFLSVFDHVVREKENDKKEKPILVAQRILLLHNLAVKSNFPSVVSRVISLNGSRKITHNLPFRTNYYDFLKMTSSLYFSIIEEEFNIEAEGMYGKSLLLLREIENHLICQELINEKKDFSLVSHLSWIMRDNLESKNRIIEKSLSIESKIEKLNELPAVVNENFIIEKEKYTYEFIQ